jgi:hypothetical protein
VTEVASLIFNGLSAVGTIATAIFTGSQLLGRRRPTVERFAELVSSEPGWIKIILSITNRDSAAVILTEISVPKGRKIVLSTEARLANLSRQQGPKMPDLGTAERSKNIYHRIGPPGETWLPTGQRTAGPFVFYADGETPPDPITVTWRWADRSRLHMLKI